MAAIRERDAKAECLDPTCHQASADRHWLLLYVEEQALVIQTMTEEYRQLEAKRVRPHIYGEETL